MCFLPGLISERFERLQREAKNFPERRPTELQDQVEEEDNETYYHDQRDQQKADQRLSPCSTEERDEISKQMNQELPSMFHVLCSTEYSFGSPRDEVKHTQCAGS